MSDSQRPDQDRGSQRESKTTTTKEHTRPLIAQLAHSRRRGGAPDISEIRAIISGYQRPSDQAIGRLSDHLDIAVVPRGWAGKPSQSKILDPSLRIQALFSAENRYTPMQCLRVLCDGI